MKRKIPQKVIALMLALSLIMGQGTGVYGSEAENEMAEETTSDPLTEAYTEGSTDAVAESFYSGLAVDTLPSPNVDDYLDRRRTDAESISDLSAAEGDILRAGGESSYSSVQNGYISQPRDQEDSSLCWAFSAAAAMEANAVKKGFFDNKTYLSPDALGYYFFNRVKDPLSLTENVIITRTATGKKSYYDNGGNPINTVFELMQWMTPLYEEDGPFAGEANTYPDTVEYAYQRDALHLENAYWTSGDSRDAIKALVREHGSAVVSVALESRDVRSVSYNGARVNTVFNDSRTYINHAVTIVGWDDDFPADLFSGTTIVRKRPEEDGAWLCKNTYTGEQYFYLSYEDASIVSTQYNNKAIAFEVGAADNYEHNYGYDGGIGTGCAAGGNVLYGAEIFKAQATAVPGMAENINAVSFATNTAGVEYTIDIYTEVNIEKGSPVAGILQKTVKGPEPLTYPGYYTIKLDKPVYVNEGEYFSVVVKLKTVDGSQQSTFMYDDSYGSGMLGWVFSNPCAIRGRSYLSLNGTNWLDTASDSLSMYRHEDSGHEPTEGYVRIKAYTDDTKAQGQYIIDSDMVALVPDQIYNCEQITPDPEVYYGANRLVKDRDYVVTYGANKSVGKGSGTLTIKGTGRYSARSGIVRTFNIKKRSLTDPFIEIKGLEDQVYTGDVTEPVTVSYNGIALKKNQDYTIRYGKSKKTGTVSVSIKGKGCFFGSRRVSFNIERRDISDEGIVVKPLKDVDYKSEPICPSVVLLNGYNKKEQLQEGKDYTVQYFDNLMPGEAQVLILGIGNYCGSRLVKFNILGADLSKANISNVSDCVFTGDPQTPEVVVYYGNRKLTESVDYEINYSNNIDVGTANIVIQGRKGTIYQGTGITRNFNIRAASINNATVENFGDVAYKAGTRYYTQNESKTSPSRLKVRLQSGYYVSPSEYTVSYEDNYSTGKTTTATMTIKATGNNVTGSITKTFSIVAGTKVLLNDFTSSNIEIEGLPSTREFIFDASNHRSNADNSVCPNVTVKYKGVALKKDEDYVVKYHNNFGKGKAYMTLEAVQESNYTGVRTEYFDIIGKPIFVTALNVADNDFYFKEPEDRVYNGYPQRPDIEIYERILKDRTEKNTSGEGVKKLQENRDYVLKYTKNVDAGVAGIKLTGIGDYSGEHTFTFNIESANLADVPHEKIKPVIYTGSEIKPEIYLQNKGGYLTEGVDYDLSYGENINVGTGNVIFTARELTIEEMKAGKVPNYVGQLTVPFTIKPRNLKDSAAIRVTGLNGLEYSGERAEPVVSLIMNNGFGDITIPESEYVVSYGGSSSAGRGRLTVRARSTLDGGSGNFTGSRAVSYSVTGASFGIARDVLDSFQVEYSGARAKFDINSITGSRAILNRGVDYTIKTDGRKDAGKGSYSLIGKGEYKGSFASGSYVITPRELDEESVEIKKLKPSAYTSASNPVKCHRMVVAAAGKKLKKGKDYVVTYYNNTAPGTATMCIAFVNNYSGSINVPFEVQ